MVFMKTRDELLQLSISQLVELALELESEVEQLRARLAELEGVDDSQLSITIPAEISESTVPAPSPEHKHARHHRRTNLWRKLFAKNKLTRTNLAVALAVVVITVLIGLFYGMYYGAVVPSGVIEK